MVNTGSSTKIVVGIDGSPASTVAAQWAADEAQRRGRPLLLVEAYQNTVVYAGRGTVFPPEVYEAPRKAAHADLARAVVDVRANHPDLDVTSEASVGTPFEVLRHAADDAELVVVGSHGQGVASETLLGSVAQKMVSHSPVPVVVIRSDPHDRPAPAPAPDAPVLVGLDGSSGSEPALSFAFEEAAVRGVELVAVRSWDDAPLNGFLRAYPLEVDRSDFDRQEEAALRAQLKPWADKDPSVTIRPKVVRGRATHVLMKESVALKPALLVVGSRGRGGFRGLVLGSTGHELAAYATCPVAIVHGPGAQSPGA
ncbi:Nucleotide-binding universal stress protein, UspA family [Nakamurella panacisegetis]|uniref:Nucleotide-binding universal stress protein, UspA family n=1 Tax=Nakamurella panacisegetis TaxID=1090615 RepID=A0A1H0SXL9_9ACTN|nr:universal stress protein [Nakamurella panacisegetis]SDP46365.1 Nucleotide-binding universal stress protein, UspA family [Nakamurella panacisegetis]